jgi:uncharacterized protein
MHRRRFGLIAVGAVVLLVVAYLATAFLMVRGATTAERKPFEAHPADFGLQHEDVSFEPRDGGPTLRGWLLQAPEDSPTIILVHGLGGQRTGDGAVDIAARLVDAGYDVLLFDLRGHGESDGNRVSGGYYERRDVLGAYDFIVERGAGPGRVGLLGLSMGAGIAIMVASQEAGIAAVVADTPFADIDDRIVEETARRTPIPEAVVPVFLPAARLFADVFYGIELGELAPADAVRQIPYPLLIIHGEADNRTPVSQSERVYGNAPAGSELWVVSGADHVDAFLNHPDEYVERVLTYFDSRLRD